MLSRVIQDFLWEWGNVADLMQFTNRVLNQDVNFMRTVQDWELEFLSNFMDVIYGTSVTGGGYSVLDTRWEKGIYDEWLLLGSTLQPRPIFSLERHMEIKGGYYWVTLFFLCKKFSLLIPKKKKKNPIIFMLEIFTADIHNSHTNDQANISRIYVFTSGKFLLLF